MADQLLIASGEGILVRRDRGLLFISDRHHEHADLLIEAFESVEGVNMASERLDRLAEVVVSSGFDVPDHVLLVADDANVVTARVFGHEELLSTLPSMPMLTAAGSKTWVEHRAALPAGPVVFSVGSGVIPGTNLDRGIVPAGGFDMHLDERVLTKPGPPQPVAAVPTPIRSQVIAVPDKLAEVAPHAVPDKVAEKASGPMVSGRRCPEGHFNPPGRVRCGQCSQFLKPGADTVEIALRPPLGQLVFSDGQRIVLDRDVIVGREPETDSHEVGITLDTDSVSRTHVKFSLSQWDVHVVDSGSTNGTLVVPHVDGSEVALEPGVAFRLEPGAIVQLGSVTCRFER